jgi:hypothetical protein
MTIPCTLVGIVKGQEVSKFARSQIGRPLGVRLNEVNPNGVEFPIYLAPTPGDTLDPACFVITGTEIEPAGFAKIKPIAYLLNAASHVEYAAYGRSARGYIWWEGDWVLLAMRIPIDRSANPEYVLTAFGYPSSAEGPSICPFLETEGGLKTLGVKFTVTEGYACLSKSVPQKWVQPAFLRELAGTKVPRLHGF